MIRFLTSYNDTLPFGPIELPQLVNIPRRPFEKPRFADLAYLQARWSSVTAMNRQDPPVAVNVRFQRFDAIIGQGCLRFNIYKAAELSAAHLFFNADRWQAYADYTSARLEGLPAIACYDAVANHPGINHAELELLSAIIYDKRVPTDPDAWAVFDRDYLYVPEAA